MPTTMRAARTTTAQTRQTAQTPQAAQPTRRAGIALAPEGAIMPNPAYHGMGGIGTPDGYSAMHTRAELADWREPTVVRALTLEMDVQASGLAEGLVGFGYLSVEFSGHRLADSAAVPLSDKFTIPMIRVEDIEVLAAGFAGLAKQLREDGVLATVERMRREG